MIIKAKVVLEIEGLPPETYDLEEVSVTVDRDTDVIARDGVQFARATGVGHLTVHGVFKTGEMGMAIEEWLDAGVRG